MKGWAHTETAASVHTLGVPTTFQTQTIFCTDAVQSRPPVSIIITSDLCASFKGAFTSSNCILQYLRPVCKLRLCCIASALHSRPPIAFFITSDLFASCASAALLQLCIHVLQLHSSLPQTCLQDAPLLHCFSSAFTSSNCILHCLRPVCKMRLCCIPSALHSRPPIAFFIASDLFARCASAASLQLCIHVLQLHSSLPQTCLQDAPLLHPFSSAFTSSNCILHYLRPVCKMRFCCIPSTLHSRPPIAFFITSDLCASFNCAFTSSNRILHYLRPVCKTRLCCIASALHSHPAVAIIITSDLFA